MIPLQMTPSYNIKADTLLFKSLWLVIVFEISLLSSTGLHLSKNIVQTVIFLNIISN